jgi:uncharacterized protein YndB with AHSA1/START domain
VSDVHISISRVFEAPRERVWQEWTEPDRFADWFGGPTSDVPLDTVAMDVRPGGAWRLTMFAEPQRRRIDWHGSYLEVEPPARLVFSVTDQPGDDRFAIVTVVFSEQTGPLPPELVEATKRGWGVFFDRIDERLQT